ncbi:N-acetylmuramoyl-L-alanine amidase [Candidatus Nomurabacteria bacterium]|nr:N-acetylmuramoyl-L-alanine amidase [Candidatus Nomurabacteria bacterium]
MEYLDKAKWREDLHQPDWYLLLKQDFKNLEKLAEELEVKGQPHKQVKQEAYAMLEEAMREGYLPIAETGPDEDHKRQPIDTIVIHHTKNQPGMTLERLNAMHMLRIYGSHYASLTDPNLKGQPVWSGHFFEGKQVFWTYHWLVREDGFAEQILEDKYIGWQAGNWDINTRSIAICIDDDLSDKEPSKAVIEAIARIIRQRYPRVSPERIIGHCDAYQNTICPGHLFHKSWRSKLIEILAA